MNPTTGARTLTNSDLEPPGAAVFAILLAHGPQVVTSVLRSTHNSPQESWPAYCGALPLMRIDYFVRIWYPGYTGKHDPNSAERITGKPVPPLRERRCRHRRRGHDRRHSPRLHRGTGTTVSPSHRQRGQRALSSVTGGVLRAPMGEKARGARPKGRRALARAFALRPYFGTSGPPCLRHDHPEMLARIPESAFAGATSVAPSHAYCRKGASTSVQ